ncbi:hypothetical protein BKA82DRAFT_991318 [Pisolithus tinctorius]|uniref:Uncharacterized protein n=1 Tax=Pisolithus tinctorius Marx 270 TaxID=870435 RepID=A0A0C3PY92_PISTI|nr:hypothetical protein BKA82DRAFT_991318 [Pisolithus tinctorius]KIO14556.1 hypothetical protein M404DRAFT_991318 [Pisolithus tinctorius Marx 270]
MDDTDRNRYNSDGTMDELAEARASLALLEEQERQLLERLCNVRSGVRVQRKRIDELVKRLIPPPISRLPITVLDQIFHLAVNDGDWSVFANLYTKEKLARVSRRWRNVILTTPGLWTNIAINPRWSASLVSAHVTRSRECPLDIEICFWDFNDEFPRFCELLGLVISCGYRWRSLVIQFNHENLEGRIIRRLWDVMFASLKRAVIDVTHKVDYPPFLDPQHARTLEYLDLGEGIELDNFSAAASLKSLCLKYPPLTAPLLLSITSLRTLTISGPNCGALLPDSIHFPLLESLTVKLEDPRSFLGAVVTPRLGYFTWSLPELSTRWSVIFADLEGKFPNVQHLCLQFSENSASYAHIQDAVAIYAAFPGVRHIEMDMLDFLAFCEAGWDDTPLSTADRWTHLERLSLVQLHCEDVIDSFIEWLHARKLRGRPPLQVTLSELNADDDVLKSPWLISLYNSLHECCVLELKDLPLTFDLTLTVHPSDSDVYGNPPIIGMLESAISTQLVYRNK